MEALLVSNLLLWVLVCILSLVVVALTRQVGLLHERVAPVGALAIERGPRVGEQAPELSVESLDGRTLQLGGVDPDGRKRLLFFLSPSCPVCATLLPTLRRMIDSAEEETRLLFASDGPRAEHEAFCKDKSIAPSDYILSRKLGLAYELSTLPFAVLNHASRTIRAQGRVKPTRHL